MMSTVSHRNHLEKTNCTHCSSSAGKLNKVIFPLQHFFGDILLEQVLGSAASNADRCALTLALVDLPGDVPIRGIPPFVWSWMAMLENPPRRSVLGTEILCHTSESFFFYLIIFGKRIQLNSVNNSDCMEITLDPHFKINLFTSI